MAKISLVFPVLLFLVFPCSYSRVKEIGDSSVKEIGKYILDGMEVSPNADTGKKIRDSQGQVIKSLDEKYIKKILVNLTRREKKLPSF